MLFVLFVVNVNEFFAPYLDYNGRSGKLAKPAGPRIDRRVVSHGMYIEVLTNPVCFRRLEETGLVKYGDNYMYLKQPRLQPLEEAEWDDETRELLERLRI